MVGVGVHWNGFTPGNKFWINSNMKDPAMVGFENGVMAGGAIKFDGIPRS